MRCAREFRQVCGNMLRHLKATAAAGNARSIGVALLSVRDAMGTLPVMGSSRSLRLARTCGSGAVTVRMCRPAAVRRAPAGGDRHLHHGRF